MPPRTGERSEGLDTATIEALVAEHSAALHRFARSLAGGDSHAAQDLVQETFLRAFEKRDTFRGEASVGTWLHRILRNLAVDRIRRHGREILAEEVEEKWRDDAYTVDGQAVVEQAETREELEEALLRLPFIYRSAVVLHDAEGWTMAEVAEALDIGLPAAKQRLRRGRMMLVTALAGGAERLASLTGVPMRCWDVRSRVSDYINGDLPMAERAVLERHLQACPTCPPLYASLVGVHDRLGDLRDPDTVVPPGLTDLIRQLRGPAKRAV
ncbi:sigma-70 family RNA polymerase sigma factor [Streptomyces sp. NPDC048623]|uniref:sigma-70 family RNA polymerase sigma factor n=1 Tax=Streptomyces sp. NPDC048623 TaxID=3155761 RepID=UPI00343F66F5